MAEGVSYTIHGTKLFFPCKAYPTQLCMMDKIMKGLDRKQHCLLESPTGSGKSLALLCSCLAWQTFQYEKAKTQREEEAVCKASPAPGCCHSDNNSAPPTIKPEKTQVSTATGCCHSDNKSASPTIKPEKIQVVDLTINSPIKNLPRLPIEDSTPLKVATAEQKLNCDEEDDFKCENKRFRTPGTTTVVSKYLKSEIEDSRSYNADYNNATKNDPPEWKIELPNKESPCSSNETKSSGESDNKKNKKNVEQIRVPKIYFGTRTHKQVAQITRELGKTAYKDIKMCILASREHTCIHPRVSTGRNKNEECRKLLDNAVKGETCSYYPKATTLGNQANIKRLGLTSAWDIEDLTRVGKKLRACPYYAARELMKEADIVFCPYNYLIDPKIRQQMEIELKDQIVVLDEAHNVEDSARESASLTITAMDLKETMDDIDKMISWRIMPNNYQPLHLMCGNLMRWMTKNSEGRMKDRGFEQAVSVMSGTDILEGLREAGMTAGAYTMYQNLFGEIMAADRDPDMQYEKTSPSPHSIMILEGLFLVLGYIFGHDGKYLSDYRVTIQKTAVVVRGEKLPGMWKRAGYGTKKEWTYSLNFWCFNPAVVFSFIGSQARSIILTSGTLSPMSSFASELGVPFPIKLEANHVIANSQVWVGTLAVGPSNSPINASYRFSETFSFQDDIGNLLLEVCEKIPHGVLCFFPSYNMMDKVSRRWQSTGLWSKLLQKKLVLSEPRGGDKTDFDDVMHEFYQAIRRSEGEDDEGVDSDDEDYCVNTGGALFLAVCRGKVSEGLDFADNNARAVITVGIPFPNTKDLKVDLKRKYNDEHTSKRGLLNGSEWYEIQAFRALNQALGRCIRHKQDWGAILLVDERFSKMPRYSNSISKWVRQRIQHYKNFNQAIGSLKDFADARQLVPCPATQTPKVTPRKSLSSTADGSFLSDTSPNREEPGTPCVSTPLVPRNDFNATDSSVPNIYSRLSEQGNLQSSNAPSQVVNQSVDDILESSGDHSKQFISTPISHSKSLDQTKLMAPVDRMLVHTQQDGKKHSLPLVNNAIPVSYPNLVGQANPSGVNGPPRTAFGVNPTGIITAVNQVLNVNSQQGIVVPQQSAPVVNNINPQAVTPRLIFIPKNALGTPANAIPTIHVNSSIVPRPTAPGSRVQQVLFLTPVQLNNQGQPPRFVYTTPKTIAFTPNKNGPPTPATQNPPAAVSQVKESVIQGNVVKSPAKDAPRPACSVNADHSTRAVAVVKEYANPSEKREEERNISGQTDATDDTCSVSRSSGESNDNIEENSEGFVDRNQSTLESTCDEEEVERSKQPLNMQDVKSLELPYIPHQSKTKNIAKNNSNVIKEDKNDVEMRDFEFPESPDMFATPSPEAEQLESQTAEDKEHGSITATADTADAPVREGPGDELQALQNGESIPQMNNSGCSSGNPFGLGLTKPGTVEEVQSRAACRKEIEDANKEVSEENSDFENETSTTRKKMRVGLNPSSGSLKNTSRNSAIGDTNIKVQENEMTLKSDIPDEIKPVRRNLRRAAQRKGAKTTRSIDNRSDVKEDSIPTTSLCCKRCNAQIFQGVATQQTIQSQHLTNLYNKLVSMNPKTRLTKKRKREGSLDRRVWTVDKNDVGENVVAMADADQVPSQQDLLNALYVPSENHLYVPLQCSGCNTKSTPCFVIGVEIMSLSTHTTTTVNSSKEVYFFSEAVRTSS
ncbi:Fanconi anemia group J protein homolog [Actinia tenebrosa]|uniref:DNA 5'-3' helicase n=1 Tax=Actinia tenebrosa TaxID=6105 RepID=A0A6P8HZJ2_ACTTE|nr:Fanconi anemia group J protein homolog [Actinia tenebrosa]